MGDFLVLCAVASLLFWSASAWARGRPGWDHKRADAVNVARLFTVLFVGALLIAVVG